MSSPRQWRCVGPLCSDRANGCARRSTCPGSRRHPEFEALRTPSLRLGTGGRRAHAQQVASGVAGDACACSLCPEIHDRLVTYAERFVWAPPRPSGQDFACSAKLHIAQRSGSRAGQRSSTELYQPGHTVSVANSTYGVLRSAQRFGGRCVWGARGVRGSDCLIASLRRQSASAARSSADLLTPRTPQMLSSAAS